MKKIIFILLIIAALPISAQNIEQAFINLPEQYLPLLSKEKRSVLLFNHSIGGADSIENDLKGISRLAVLDSNYLKVNLTEKSTFEMKIWHLNDTAEIIGFSHTVCAPVCDSQVAFFDKNFRRLDTDGNQMFPDIAVQDFLNVVKIADEGERVENVVKKHDALFATISFSPKDNDIVLKSNAKEFLPKEIYADLEKYLIGDSIELTFENGIFREGAAQWR
ncbi:MAG: DUF3256 family protein [Prevotellaceae bacterium]|jgi:hypothetical protein|nr:DUF3256 family protein [Prevotellaceae bacterium]